MTDSKVPDDYEAFFDDSGASESSGISNSKDQQPKDAKKKSGKGESKSSLVGGGGSGVRQIKGSSFATGGISSSQVQAERQLNADDLTFSPIEDINRGKMNNVNDYEEQLRQKEEELNRREASLRRLEANKDSNVGVDGSGQNVEGKPNFPICYPIFRHDIRNDVKSGLPKAIAYEALFGFLILTVMLVLNLAIAWVCVFLPVLPGGGVPSLWLKVQYMIFAHLLVLLIPPMHFFICYLPVYFAMRSPSAVRFCLVFIAYVPLFLFGLFSVSGYYELGVGGLYLMILFLSGNGTMGWGDLVGFLLNLILTIIWSLILLYFFSIVVQLIVLFRRENLNFRNATDYLKKQVVKTTTSVVASSVVSAATAGINDDGNVSL